MKRSYLIAIIIIFAVLLLLIIMRGNEDLWIKDDKGIWIKHGNPSQIPDYVAEQQDAIECANGLYSERKAEGVELSSKCLGICYDYAVDVVHVPRIEEDNQPENQCEEYRAGEVSQFIELDKEGNVVRIE